MKIKIRAAVAYTASGEWMVKGWSRESTQEPADDESFREYVYEWVASGEGPGVIGHHFITAEIEVPDPLEPAEVLGEVAGLVCGVGP